MELPRKDRSIMGAGGERSSTCPFLHAFLDDLAYALKKPAPTFIDPNRAEELIRVPGASRSNLAKPSRTYEAICLYPDSLQIERKGEAVCMNSWTRTANCALSGAGG